MAGDEKDLGSLFDWFEYTVFGMTMAISVFIGVYYGFIKKRGQNTVEGYILGEKQISLLPMATSLVASFISGIALLGLSAEAYTYGTQYLISNFTFILVSIVNATVFVPVFYKLQCVSVYEYLEARFDHRIRKAASLIYTFYLVSYIPIVIYAPALALNQVGKINIHLITPMVCAVCIFYTSVGGLKAVVWTDVLQTSIMVISMFSIVAIGIQSTGGLASAYETVQAGGRWEWFNMDPSPTARATFWTVNIGMFFHWLGESACNPSFVQRFVALPSEADAKKSILGLTVGSIFFRVVAATVGLLAYAKYHGCDPLSTKEVNKADQISPYFVLDVAGHVKGLPGLYMSGIFAAALSTMSGGLNTIAATIYKDLMLPFYKNPPSDERASTIMKRLSLSFGILSVVLIFLVEKMGNIIDVTTSLGGSSSGLLSAFFILGLFVPFGNSKGAACGGIVATILIIWVYTGNRIAIMKGQIVYPTKPMSVVDCPGNVTTIYGSNLPTEGYVFPLYKLSVFCYSVFCFTTALVVSICVSWLTGGNKGKTIDPALFSPYIHRYLKNTSEPVRNVKERQKNGEGYASVPLKEINDTT